MLLVDRRYSQINAVHRSTLLVETEIDTIHKLTLFTDRYYLHIDATHRSMLLADRRYSQKQIDVIETNIKKRNEKKSE